MSWGAKVDLVSLEKELTGGLHNKETISLPFCQKKWSPCKYRGLERPRGAGDVNAVLRAGRVSSRKGPDGLKKHLRKNAVTVQLAFCFLLRNSKLSTLTSLNTFVMYLITLFNILKYF